MFGTDFDRMLLLSDFQKSFPMDAQINLLAILKLNSQLSQEEEEYIAAMRSNKLFWELKLIYNRIKKLKSELEKIYEGARALSSNSPVEHNRTG